MDILYPSLLYYFHMIDIPFTSSEKDRLHSLAVKALLLFGSRAQKVATEKSDYDILVLGPKNKKTYDTLYEILSQKINKLVNIDIVFLEDATMELQSHTAKYGVILYHDSPTTFADFREKVMQKYADFAPLRHIFQQATLKRIRHDQSST